MPSDTVELADLRGALTRLVRAVEEYNQAYYAMANAEAPPDPIDWAQAVTDAQARLDERLREARSSLYLAASPPAGQEWPPDVLQLQAALAWEVAVKNALLERQEAWARERQALLAQVDTLQAELAVAQTVPAAGPGRDESAPGVTVVADATPVRDAARLPTLDRTRVGLIRRHVVVAHTARPVGDAPRQAVYLLGDDVDLALYVKPGPVAPLLDLSDQAPCYVEVGVYPARLDPADQAVVMAHVAAQIRTKPPSE